MSNIALVGLGAIGFRHLQGLATAESSLKVYGVDPDQEARGRASCEWAQTKGGGFTAATSAHELPESIDILIIATSARDRLRVLEEILTSRHVGKVILEKVAFTSRAEFDHAFQRGAGTRTEVFVNCPRRLWLFYVELKQFLNSRGGTFTLHYTWQRLGLACNGVHFIDLLQYLSGVPEVTCRSSDLREVVPAKRQGYFEVLGSLEVGTPRGHSLRLECDDNAPQEMLSWLHLDGERLSLDELHGRLISPDGSELLTAGPPPFQSALTGKVVDALLQGRDVTLPHLEESCLAHQALFDALIPRFHATGIDISSGLPIT